MEKNQDQYLHIPFYILNEVKLDPSSKILLSSIISLSKTSAGCYASNGWFSQLLNINPDGASKQISKLKRLGYIETKRMYKNSKEYRAIKVLNRLNNNVESDILINIPYSVLFDINLSSTQKLLLSEIISLLKLPEGCYKSNNDFGKLIGISGSAVSKQIKKLVEIDYITIEEIKIGNVIDHRIIELGTSYITRGVVPKTQEGTSYMTRGVVPKTQEGTSYRNTINTINNTLELLPELAQITTTENKIDFIEIEQKIINSCERGAKLLEQAKKNCIDNYWYFGNSNQEVEYLMQIVNEYQDAKNNN
jgi:Mn-dependent DtxR family transcriptional regulator